MAGSGKYRLDARLGGGGMAEVFVGSTVGAEGFARKVAIKRVLPGYSENPQFAKMFIDEARITSRLSHPNIVGVLDFDRDPDGRLYLVMELVYGKDLAALATTGALPIPVVIFVIAEALRGLGHAHDLPYVVDDMMIAGSNTIRSMRGLVHRDVSPHNVLLSWEGAVKVSDFGIAKARTASLATASELIKGKPAYMSPEQANGETLDGRSDLFAVGVMLWELLAGRRLFTGDDTRALLAAVLFGKIPKLRTVRPDVPKDLERVAAKLLERELPNRYQNAEAALAELLACAQAPKNGAALLRDVLAERFSAEAPVRHSLLRKRSTPPGVTPPPSGSFAPPHGPPIQPAPAPPYAVTELQGARTHALPETLDRERMSRRRVALIVGGIVAVIVVIAIVASSGSSKPASPSGSPIAFGGAVTVDVDAAPTPDAAMLPDASPVASAAPVVDAAPIAIDAAPVAIDAPPIIVDAAKPPATHEHSASARASRKTGGLQIFAFPALTVYIDGKRIHDTPLKQQLPVGRHTVRLVNRDIGRDESLSVVIRENQTETIHREQD